MLVFPAQELEVLKAEFGHHVQKVAEYEQLKREVDRIEGISLGHRFWVYVAKVCVYLLFIKILEYIAFLYILQHILQVICTPSSLFGFVLCTFADVITMGMCCMQTLVVYEL